MTAAPSGAMVARPQIAEARDKYTFRPGTQTVSFFAGPRGLNRPHAIIADATIPAGGAEGVLLCQYQGLFRFTGELHTVTVDLSGEPIDDRESECCMAMARR